MLRVYFVMEYLDTRALDTALLPTHIHILICIHWVRRSLAWDSISATEELASSEQPGV
jgi:hypothetical protein